MSNTQTSKRRVNIESAIVSESDTSQLMWREAIAQYVDDSEDYVKTIKETEGELRFWRGKVLQERFDAKLALIESVLSKSNEEVLASLEHYVEKEGIDSLDDSLMMRLAQLHYDRALFNVSKNMKKYENEMAAYQKNKKGKAPELPAPDYTKSIFYAENLLNRFHSSPLSDRAFYLLGYCLYDSGNYERAIVVYEKMVKRYPFSDYSIEARWRLAESSFDSGQYEKSIIYYKYLAESENQFSQKALYKMGAAQFALGKFSEAAQLFILLYSRTEQLLGTGNPEIATLQDEAIDYLSHIKSKGVDLKLELEFDAVVTDRLAEAYNRAQDYIKSRNTHLNFIKLHPLFKDVAHFYSKVIQSYEAEGDLERAQGVRNAFTQSLNSNSPFWERYKSEIGVIVEAQDLYEANILFSADYYADIARTTRKGQDYRAAIGFYKKFISDYPFSSLRSQAQIELAELQYFAGYYADASGSYLDILSQPENNYYKEEAAYGYFLAELKRANFPLSDNGNLKPQRNSKGELAKPSNFTPAEESYIQAANFYLDTINHGIRRQRILYRTATVYFQHNRFEEARKYLEDILGDPEVSIVSTSAIRMMSISYDVENKWEKALETNKRLLTLVQNVDIESADTEMRLKKSNTLTQAYNMEKSNRYNEAVGLYEAFLTKNAETDDASFALFRTGILYRQLGQIPSSTRNFNRLIKNFPKSEYVQTAEYLNAANLVSEIKFEDAAVKYEKFARQYKNHPLSNQAWLNASSLRQQMAQKNIAADDFYEFAKKVQDDEIWMQAATYYLEAGLDKNAQQIFSKFEKSKSSQNYVIRAHFERAWRYADVDKVGANRKRSFSECKQIALIQKKGIRGIQASGVHSIDGCYYLKTLSTRDAVVSSTEGEAHPKWGELKSEYEKIQNKKDYILSAYVYADQGMIAESFAEKAKTDDEKMKWKAESNKFYTESLKMAYTSENPTLTSRNTTGLRRLGDIRYVVRKSWSYWPLWQHNSDILDIAWDTESHPLKPLADQQQWDEAVEASKALPISPIVYMVRARAALEKGQFKLTQENLTQCFMKFKNPDCAAGLLNLGIKQDNIASLDEVLSSSLKTETHPTWYMAKAAIAYNNGNPKEVFKELQNALGEKSDFVPTYEALMRTLVEGRRIELARTTLNEALRVVDINHEGLRIKKAYLSLLLGQVEAASAIATDLNNQKEPSPDAVGLKALVDFYKNDSSTALEVLKKDFKTAYENEHMKYYKLASALYLNNTEDASRYYSELQSSEVSPIQQILFGYYQSLNTSDKKSSYQSFTRAKDLGFWGRWVDEELNSSRQPAQEEKK